MTSKSHADLEAAAQAAEEQRRQGDTAGALASYQALILQRLTDGRTQGTALETLKAADIVIIDRLVNLATLLGYAEAADNLLDGMEMLNQEAGNRYGADYIRFKRIHLALANGDLQKAYELLRSLEQDTDSLSNRNFSAEDLRQCEVKYHELYPNRNERAVFFSRFYFMLGWLRASDGRYEQALIALQRGLSYTGKNAPPLACQSRVPLQLACAKTFIERGHISAALSMLNACESKIDADKEPTLRVQWLETSGKIHLRQGALGAACEQFKIILTICEKYGFHQATLRATLNLAHILIFLNRTSLAQELVLSVQDVAIQNEEKIIAVRAQFLYQLAETRGRSFGESTPLAKGVTAMLSESDKDDTFKADNRSVCSLSMPRSSNFLTFFEDQTAIFYQLLGQQNIVMADQHLNQMQQIFGASDSELIQVRLQILEGILAHDQGNYVGAATKLAKASMRLRALDLKPDLWQALRLLNACYNKLEVLGLLNTFYSKLGQPVLERYHLIQETKVLLQSMTESLRLPDQTIFLLDKWTTEEEYIASEVKQLTAMKQQLGSSFFFMRPWRRMKFMHRIKALIHYIDRYKDALAIHGSKDRQAKRPPAPSLWRPAVNTPS